MQGRVMIVDTTQTRVERQMKPILTNQQREEILAQLLSTEIGRQILMNATECWKKRSNDS